MRRCFDLAVEPAASALSVGISACGRLVLAAHRVGTRGATGRRRSPPARGQQEGLHLARAWDSARPPSIHPCAGWSQVSVEPAMQRRLGALLASQPGTLRPVAGRRRSLPTAPLTYRRRSGR